MSDASMVNGIAGIASGMKAESIQQQISVAVMKEVMDAQKIEGEAIAKMMDQSAVSPDTSVGQVVNIPA